MKNRDELEKEIYDHLIDNIDEKNNPENYWKYNATNNLSNQYCLTRSDGLKLQLTSDT